MKPRCSRCDRPRSAYSTTGMCCRCEDTLSADEWARELAEPPAPTPQAIRQARYRTANRERVLERQRELQARYKARNREWQLERQREAMRRLRARRRSGQEDERDQRGAA